MGRFLREILEAIPSPGGKLLVTLAVLTMGMIAEAVHVTLGHDLALASLGALIAQLHSPSQLKTRLRRRL